ncbi:hypothetical protein BaRGS_00014389 [Batillaria attramentaria]|uniref:Uncharacterized protein n=1 Tax=Batillaria attramentaria TaxID=370345 RepID=A0ABD0L4X4_9CAEN
MSRRPPSSVQKLLRSAQPVSVETWRFCPAVLIPAKLSRNMDTKTPDTEICDLRSVFDARTLWGRVFCDVGGPHRNTVTSLRPLSGPRVTVPPSYALHRDMRVLESMMAH